MKTEFWFYPFPNYPKTTTNKRSVSRCIARWVTTYLRLLRKPEQ